MPPTITCISRSIGEIEGNGQFNVVWQTEEPVRAQPWSRSSPGMIKARSADEDRQQLSHYCREKSHERHAHDDRYCMAYRTAAGMAQASDADQFVAASRSQQADMLTRWALAPDAARLPLLQALQNENLFADSQKHAFARRNGEMVALGDSPAAEGQTKAVRLTNRLRVLAATANATHQLISDNVTQRRAAARQLQRDAQPEMIGLLQTRVSSETDDVARQSLLLALANLQLASPQADVRLQAIERLGQSDDPDVPSRLMPYTQTQTEPDARVRAAAGESLSQIQHRLMWGDLLGQAFMGLSLGSVLLLAALGLAITYGLLGVINMAHGEMLMLGAYATWMVQQIMASVTPQWLALYPVVALPVAFCLTAGIGMILERTVIRHLYGRPLETLLATGYQPDADSAGTHDVWRTKPEVANPAAVRRGAGVCQPDATVEPHCGIRLCADGAVLHGWS